MFTFLINNIYVKFQGKVYKQGIGIPIGCDCAPKVAALFLYWYEHSYISEGLLTDNPIISKLKYFSRYIDDLNIPNTTLEVHNAVCNDIYPIELKVSSTNDDPNRCKNGDKNF